MGKLIPPKVISIAFIILAIASIGVVGYYSYLNIRENDNDREVKGQNTVQNWKRDNRYCMFGVHDQGGGNTQFFHLVMDESKATPIGPMYNRYDIESMDIDPYSKEIIAIAGGGNNQGDRDGEIFKFDKINEKLVQIGDTGIRGDNEVVSASFHPNGEFWAFQENVGIITIGITAEDMGEVVVKWPATTEIKNLEGLAWNVQGTRLYGTQGRDLFEWNPSTQSAKKICKNNFLPSTTEALEFRNDGKLYGGYHNSSIETLNIFEIELGRCAIKPTDYATPYNDVETITFDLCSETLPPTEEEPPVDIPPAEEEPPTETDPPVEEPPVEEEPTVEDQPQVEIELPTGDESTAEAEPPVQNETPEEDEVVEGTTTSTVDENIQVLSGTITSMADASAFENDIWDVIALIATSLLAAGIFIKIVFRATDKKGS